MYFISVEQYLELRGLKIRISQTSQSLRSLFPAHFSSTIRPIPHEAQFQDIPLCASRHIIIVLIVTGLVENSRENFLPIVRDWSILSRNSLKSCAFARLLTFGRHHDRSSSWKLADLIRRET